MKDKTGIKGYSYKSIPNPFDLAMASSMGKILFKSKVYCHR